MSILKMADQQSVSLVWEGDLRHCEKESSKVSKPCNPRLLVRSDGKGSRIFELQICRDRTITTKTLNHVELSKHENIIRFVGGDGTITFLRARNRQECLEVYKEIISRCNPDGAGKEGPRSKHRSAPVVDDTTRARQFGKGRIFGKGRTHNSSPGAVDAIFERERQDSAKAWREEKMKYPSLAQEETGSDTFVTPPYLNMHFNLTLCLDRESYRDKHYLERVIAKAAAEGNPETDEQGYDRVQEASQQWDPNEDDQMYALPNDLSDGDHEPSNTPCYVTAPTDEKDAGNTVYENVTVAGGPKCFTQRPHDMSGKPSLQAKLQTTQLQTALPPMPPKKSPKPVGSQENAQTARGSDSQNRPKKKQTPTPRPAPSCWLTKDGGRPREFYEIESGAMSKPMSLVSDQQTPRNPLGPNPTSNVGASHLRSRNLECNQPSPLSSTDTRRLHYTEDSGVQHEQADREPLRTTQLPFNNDELTSNKNKNRKPSGPGPIPSQSLSEILNPSASSKAPVHHPPLPINQGQERMITPPSVAAKTVQRGQKPPKVALKPPISNKSHVPPEPQIKPQQSTRQAFDSLNRESVNQAACLASKTTSKKTGPPTKGERREPPAVASKPLADRSHSTRREEIVQVSKELLTGENFEMADADGKICVKRTELTDYFKAGDEVVQIGDVSLEGLTAFVANQILKNNSKQEISFRVVRRLPQSSVESTDSNVYQNVTFPSGNNDM